MTLGFIYVEYKERRLRPFLFIKKQNSFERGHPTVRIRRYSTSKTLSREFR